MERTAREELRDFELPDDRMLSPGLPNPFASLRRASLSPTKPYSERNASLSPMRFESRTVAVMPSAPVEVADATRKRRRVTFSARQEKTYAADTHERY